MAGLQALYLAYFSGEGFRCSWLAAGLPAFGCLAAALAVANLGRLK